MQILQHELTTQYHFVGQIALRRDPRFKFETVVGPVLRAYPM